jgi:hypothetical protein
MDHFAPWQAKLEWRWELAAYLSYPAATRPSLKHVMECEPAGSKTVLDRKVRWKLCGEFFQGK